MPALSLSESHAAAITHALFPIQPGILAALQEEDFLLMHSCVANASYKKRRRVNNAGVCYSLTYEDFELTYRCTAEVTARWGLGNYRPGRKLNEASMAWFANGVEPLFGVKGGVLIYEEPVVTHLPSDLPGITFTVARENCEVDDGQLVIPKVDAVTLRSWPVPEEPPPTGSRYDLLYNTTVIWIRKDGPLSDGGTDVYYRYYLKAPAGSPRPATLAAFLAQPYVPAEVPGQSVIEEVITLGPGDTITVLREGAGLLPVLVEAGGVLPLEGVEV